MENVLVKNAVKQRGNMGRKGKTQKHTAKEIAAKHKAAKERNGAAGGGGKLANARKSAGSKSSVLCHVCKVIQPNMKSMTLHFENKHSKLPFPKEDYDAQFLALKTAKASAQKSKGKASKDGKKGKKK